MKRLSGYFLSMTLVLISLIILDVAVMFLVFVRTEKPYHDFAVNKVSELISYSNGEYSVDSSVYDLLDKTGSFAMIIEDSGDVIWDYKKPADLPETYGIKDVALFGRWYLNDYPAYTWVRDEGILVVGHPKGSVWKYFVEFNTSTLDAMLRILPYIVIINILILVILPVMITRRWMVKREKSRTEWIAGVSHDIRTPLSIVMGSVDKGSVEEKQCYKIRDLIGNLNTENKLESGTGKWNEETITLSALLRGTVCDFANTYEEGYAFDLDIDESLEGFTIKADNALIKRMIENLIINSISHNEQGCNIKLSLSDNGKGKAKLVIHDDGMGADAGKIKALNAKIKSEYLPEHGLGIRVVKQVAKRYGYSVRFASVPNTYFQCEIVF